MHEPSESEGQAGWKLAPPWPRLHCTISLQSESPPSTAEPPSPPWPPYHPGGVPDGRPGLPPAPLFSPRCAPAPRRTCCLPLSALRPSSPLPLGAAGAVGAGLGRGLFQRGSHSQYRSPHAHSLAPGAASEQPRMWVCLLPTSSLQSPPLFLPLSVSATVTAPQAHGPSPPGLCSRR